MILKLNIEFQSFLHERMSKNSGTNCNYNIINAINLQIIKVPVVICFHFYRILDRVPLVFSVCTTVSS